MKHRDKLVKNAFDLISGLVSSDNDYSIDYKYGFVEGVIFATGLLLADDRPWEMDEVSK